MCMFPKSCLYQEKWNKFHVPMQLFLFPPFESAGELPYGDQYQQSYFSVCILFSESWLQRVGLFTLFGGIFDLWWLQSAPSSFCDHRKLVILESWLLNLFSPVPHVVVFSAEGFYQRRTGWWIRFIPKIPCPGNVSSVSGFDSNSRWWVSRAKAAMEERRCGIRAIMASSSWLSPLVAHHGLSLCGRTSLCWGCYTLAKRRWHFYTPLCPF